MVQTKPEIGIKPVTPPSLKEKGRFARDRRVEKLSSSVKEHTKAKPEVAPEEIVDEQTARIKRALQLSMKKIPQSKKK